MDRPVAIITGAGRGIGRATAVELARRGYRLTLVARTAGELHQTDEHAGAASLHVVADVADPDVAGRAVTQTLEQHKRVDALVHCAGVAPMLEVEQTTDLVWREVIDVNLSSAFYFARAVWPIFRRQRSGVIVNLSSFSARDPFRGFSAYAAAKGGLNLLGLSLARDGAEFGIHVHTVAPAAVETGMLRKLFSEAHYPAEKALSPQDVAAVIAGCVVGELRYTSGEVIWLQKNAS